MNARSYPQRGNALTTGKRCRFEHLEDRRVMAVVLGESTFDIDQFSDNLDDYFSGNVVGYGYAISQGQTPAARTGAGGLARRAADGPVVAFTSTTETENASVSKTITVAAILRLLEQTTPNVDAALSAKLVDYLPSDWNPGSNIGNISLRMLLTHRTGLSESSNPVNIEFESFGNNTMQNLKALVEAGVGAPSNSPDSIFDDNYWNYSYNNANLSLIAKVVLPKMLFPGANFTAANYGGYNNLNQITGDIYKGYTKLNVLQPAGVNAEMDVDESDNTLAKGYSFPSPLNETGYSQRDLTDVGGAFGWKLNAVELSRFLEGLRTNEIISAQTRQLMLDQQLGIFRGTNDWGNFYGHNGAAGSGSRGFRSKIEMLPGNIDVALLINSNPSGLPDADNNGSPDSISDLIQSAYLNAWSDVVYEANDLSNFMQIVINNSGPRQTLELWVDNQLEYSQGTSTLDSLTINGLDGNDQLYADRLPVGLEVTFNGNAGNDRLVAAAGTRRMESVRGLNFNGGGGTDELVVNDQNNPYSHALSHSYTVSNTRVGRFMALNYLQPQIPLPVGIDYTSAALKLYTGAGSDIVRVTSIAGASRIDTGLGNDTILLSEQDKNLDAVGGLTVNGGVGYDTVVAHDNNNPYSHALSRIYTINDQQVSRFRGLPINQIQVPVPVVVQHENVDVLNVRTGNGADYITIGGAGSNALLALNANNGADQVFVSGAAFQQMNLEGGNPIVPQGDGDWLSNGDPLDSLTMTVPEGMIGTHTPHPLVSTSGSATLGSASLVYTGMEDVDAQFPAGDLIGDFNSDGAVDDDDLHDRIDGWHTRYGTATRRSLDGGNFLSWQRHHQPRTIPRTGPDGLTDLALAQFSFNHQPSSPTQITTQQMANNSSEPADFMAESSSQAASPLAATELKLSYAHHEPAPEVEATSSVAERDLLAWDTALEELTLGLPAV